MVPDAGTAATVPPVGAPPDIAVVVPTFNRPEGITALLHALAGQTLAPECFEVIVVDDCSSDDTVARLTALGGAFPYRLTVLQTPRNAGPGAARNVGWRAATAALLAFLDDDCQPEPGWLEAGRDYLAANEAVGVAQGLTRAPDGVDVHRLQGWYVWRVITDETPYFDACNIFYRRDALADADGFDTEIGWWPSFGFPGAVPVAWAEDCAAGWAVVEDGWDRGFVTAAVVIHEVETRPLRWHLKHAYLDRAIVALAVAHPGFRAEAFWRPWAYRKEDAAFMAAVAGVVATRRWRPAAVAVLPYLWLRRPSTRKPNFLTLCAGYVAIDAARAVGRLSGAVKFRTFVV